MQASTCPCFINFRLSPDLFRHLDATARQAGVTRAKLLRDLIAELQPVEREPAALQDRAA